MKHIYTKLLLIASLFIMVGLNAQDHEKELNDAQKAFSYEYYEDAFPTFDKLIKLYPENPDYNFWYGATLMQTDRKNPELFLKHLQFAKDHQCKEPQLKYYLGFALMQNFRFKEASEAFSDFIKFDAQSKKEEKLAQKRLDQCEIAMSLTNPDIFSKLLFQEEIKTHNLYRYYQSLSYPGNIILVPRELESYKDQKKNELSFAFVTQEKDKIFFSSYENNNHRDLYFAPIDENGEYGEISNLGDVVNTGNNEIFPVFDNRENTLYFASDGHEGIGGLDIFSTVYDPETKSWSAPQNLWYPINSVFDDFLFVRDLIDPTQAFFTSDRLNKKENITFFTIVTQSKDAQALASLDEESKNQKEAEADLQKDIIDPVAVEELTDDHFVSDDNLQHKAEHKIWEKNKANCLTDSAFAIIENYQNRIDGLAALMNRSNIVANTQNTKSKALFTQFFRESRNQIDNKGLESLNIITQKIESLEKDALATYERSIQANTIGENIGHQINHARITMEGLKDQAADIQLSAATEAVTLVEQKYANFLQYFNEADTLISYEKFLDDIAYDKSKVLLPDEKIIDITSYLKNMFFIEHNRDQLSDHDQNNITGLLNESNSLMHLAINSYERGYSGVNDDKKEYIISDARTFSEKSINTQLDAMLLIDENIASLTKHEEDLLKDEPILTDEKLPVIEDFTEEELQPAMTEFKIQLGAFGQAVNENIFSNIRNLSSEKVEGTNMTRYFSGHFNDLATAEREKNLLKDDFPGAFIVAYQNGEKVPLSSIDMESSSVHERNLIPEHKPNLELSLDVTKNTGDLYYIKLGTFSQPKTSSDLFNISPLYYEKLSNGMIRYFAGPYKELAETESNLVRIKSSGATSAFVVHYNQGVQQATTTGQSIQETKQLPKADQGDLVFKIQLGAFSQQKSSAWRKELAQRTGSPIDETITDNGMYVYTTGSFVELDAASTFKEQLLSKGIDGVFIAAFLNGVKIPLKQAMEKNQ